MLNYVISYTSFLLGVALMIVLIGIPIFLMNNEVNSEQENVVYETKTQPEQSTTKPKENEVPVQTTPTPTVKPPVIVVPVGFQKNDGGRLVAGYSSGESVNDCAPRAIALATDRPYQTVYTDLQYITYQKMSQDPFTYNTACCDNGTYIGVVKEYMAHQGWMYYESNLSLLQYSDELYSGDVIIHFNKHIFTIRNGIVYDTENIFTSPEYATDRNINPQMNITGYFKKI